MSNLRAAILRRRRRRNRLLNSVSAPDAVTSLAITGASGGVVADLTPEATWTASPGATSYDVEIAATGALTGTPDDSVTAPTTSYTFPAQTNFTTYDIGVRPVGPGGLGPWATITVTIEYRALDDGFAVDESAPLASPANVSPGPGIRTRLADVGNDAAIASAKLSLTTTGGWDQTVYQWAQAGDVAFDRAAGLVLRATLVPAAGAKLIFGWDDTNTLTYPRDHAIYLNGANFLHFDDGEKTGKSSAQVVNGQTYELWQVLRETGCDYYIKRPGQSVRMLWLDRYAFGAGGSPTQASMKVKLSHNSGAATLDDVQVYPLGAPFNTDYGVASVNVESFPTTQQTAIADSFFGLDFTLPGSPSGGDRVSLKYRIVDANNYWEAYVEWSGAAWDFKLDKVVSGSPTNAYTVASVGTPSGIRVRALGNSHFTWTRTTSWADRGAGVASDSTHATATGLHYAAAAGTTLERLYAFAEELAAYAALT